MMRTRSWWLVGCFAVVAGVSCTSTEAPPPVPVITHLAIVQGDSQTAKAGTTLPVQLVVVAYDDSLRAAAGATVCFQVPTSNSGSIMGQVNGQYCPTVDTNGHAFASWTIGATPGSNIALASGGNQSNGVSFYATGTP